MSRCHVQRHPPPQLNYLDQKGRRAFFGCRIKTILWVLTCLSSLSHSRNLRFSICFFQRDQKLRLSKNSKWSTCHILSKKKKNTASAVSFTSCLWEAKGKKHFLDHMHYYERHYGKVGSGQEFQRSKFKTEHCRSMSYVTWIKFLNFFMPGSSHLE